jgi:hypothetical protein
MVAATLTILALFALFMKFGRTFRETVIGYDIIADIVITGLFLLLFGSTGTISGMMTAIIAGLIVSVMLFIAKKACTSRTFHIKRVGFKLIVVWNVHHGYYHNYVRSKV